MNLSSYSKGKSPSESVQFNWLNKNECKNDSFKTVINFTGRLGGEMVKISKHGLLLQRSTPTTHSTTH